MSLRGRITRAVDRVGDGSEITMAVERARRASVTMRPCCGPRCDDVMKATILPQECDFRHVLVDRFRLH